MPPKKATAVASQKKASAAPTHPSYKDMIKEAILKGSAPCDPPPRRPNNIHFLTRR
ncbi:MAG: hypothetical protein LQ352_000053 [Teloschistes flavicans]|nr:MAG: hypothetical protein LQ352_000053 [Teloschistes flavicans]